MGALVAFEMARQLQARGETVELLTLIDPSSATGTRVSIDVDDANQLLAWFASDQGQLAGQEAWVPDAAVLDALPQGRALFEVFANNLRAMKRYEPTPLPGRIVVLRASAGLETEQNDRGWSVLAQDGLLLQEVPGNHYSVLRAPNVRTLAERLARLLG